MATNPPSPGRGAGPSPRKQGKRGPITTNWTFQQGSNGSSKPKVAPHRVGPSPSKSRSSWYLGGKKR
jgi:hypothetical protein